MSPEARREIHKTGTTESMKPEALAIAEKLRERDPEILDYLIVQHQDRLLRYLLYLTGSIEMAEDFVQETWMRVIMKGNQFRGESQFITWLFSIARNLVRDRRRRSPSRLSELSTTMDGQPLEIVSTAQSPYERYVRLELGQNIARKVMTLSPPQREVLLLHYMEELPLKEIAQLTAVSLSTARVRLYRAIRVLRSNTAAVDRIAPQIK